MIIFSGQWVEDFEPELTDPKSFKISPNSEKTVPMMFLQTSEFGPSKLKYVADPDLACSAIDMPYVGERLSMVVILPNETFGLQVS